MKKTITTLTVIAIICMGMLSCGGSKSNTPSDTVKSMFDYLMDEDYESVIGLYSSNGKMLSDEEAEKLGGMMSMVETEYEKNEGLKDIEILEETISEDGNSAKVKYKILFKDGSDDDQKVSLSKIDGKWYIEVMS